MLFGATNRGGQSHLTGELFRDRSKANISFVHAAGAAASMNDVIAGRIPIVFEGLAGMNPGIKGGGVKLLGIAAPKRLPNLPDLPALNETVPGVVSSGWIVLMAPAGVPDPIIQKLNADLRKVVAMPEVHGAVSSARHLHARSDAGADRRIHAQRGEAVVADRAPGEQGASSEIEGAPPDAVQSTVRHESAGRYIFGSDIGVVERVAHRPQHGTLEFQRRQHLLLLLWRARILLDVVEREMGVTRGLRRTLVEIG